MSSPLGELEGALEGTMPHATGGTQCSQGGGEDRDNQLDDSLPGFLIRFHIHSNFGPPPLPPPEWGGVYTPLMTRDQVG